MSVGMFDLASYNRHGRGRDYGHRDYGHRDYGHRDYGHRGYRRHKRY